MCRYRQRLRLLQSDTEKPSCSKPSGMGAPVALTRSRIARWLAGIISANGFCQAAFVIAELVNQLAVGVEQCFD